MAQNIYDNPEFFAAYSRIPRQVRGLDGAPEWPRVEAMLPDPAGRHVADLGCGFGWVSRWMREQGAASVLGVDLSQNMIARAKASTNDPAIEYRIGDIDSLELPEESFDLIFSSLTFHYVEDFARLIRMIGAALVPKGALVFTIEHPIFMAPARPRWTLDEDGNHTWPLNRYSVEGERQTDWITKGVVKFHRTLGTTLNTLIGSGFELCRVEEFAPTPEQVVDRPDLAEEVERPMILLISAKKR